MQLHIAYSYETFMFNTFLSFLFHLAIVRIPSHSCGQSDVVRVVRWTKRHEARLCCIGELSLWQEKKMRSLQEDNIHLFSIHMKIVYRLPT